MTTLHTVAATGALKLSWLLLAFPLFGAAVLLLGGRRTNRWGHLLGVAMPVAAFVYGVIAFFTLLGLGTSQRSQDVHLYSWIPVAGFQVNMNLLVDQLSICFVLLITGVGVADHHLLGRLHEPRPRPAPVLRLHEPVPRGHAAARARRQLPGALRRVGGRRPGLLPADRVLAVQALGGGRGEEGVHRQPGRRRRAHPGHLPDVRRVRHGVVHRGVRYGEVRPGAAWPRRSGCCSCSARAASPRRCRCSPGCSTRWRARPRCRR